MKFISNYINTVKNKINSINPKHALQTLKVATFILVGAVIGFLIHGPLGSIFGLILGYVLGRSLIK
jgi:F0F1-type ATP synthase assembly protein I